MTNEELKKEIESLRTTVEENWRGHVSLQDRWLNSTMSDRLEDLEKAFRSFIQKQKRLNTERAFMWIFLLYLMFTKS